MSDSGLTDAVYERIGRFEHRKRRLAMAVLGCSVLASVVILVDSYIVVAYSHQKGISSDTVLLLIALLSLVCIALAGVAAERFIKLKRIDERLSRFREMEEVIQREVLTQDRDS